MLTADCMVTNQRGEILLVRRGNDPYKDCWALPGGFMEMDETTNHCAVRELEEETGLVVSEQDIRLIGVYSAPGRDPRGRTVTAAYRVVLGTRSSTLTPFGSPSPSLGEEPRKLNSCSPKLGELAVQNGLTEECIKAGDDAAEVRWWPLDKLPPLAFDHAQIVSDGQRL